MHRTTVRIEPELAEAAKKLAVARNISFQEVINWSLKTFLQIEPAGKKEDENLIDQLPTQDLGIDLGTLSRNRIYGPPKI